MKKRLKKVLSAGLACVFVLSVAIPVFGAVQGSESEAVTEVETADPENSETTVLFLDTAERTEENQSAEKTLRSVKEVLEQVSKTESPREVLLVLCVGTVLNEEEAAKLSETGITVIAQEQYEKDNSSNFTDTPGETSLSEQPDDVSPIPLLAEENAEPITEENSEPAAEEVAATVTDETAQPLAAEGMEPVLEESASDVFLQENLQEAAEQMMQPEVLAAPDAAAAEMPLMEAEEPETNVSEPAEEPAVLFAAPQPQETAEAPVPAEPADKAAEAPVLTEPADKAVEAPAFAEPVQTPEASERMPEVQAAPVQTAVEAPAAAPMVMLSLPGRDLVGTGTTQSSSTASATAPQNTEGQSRSVTPVNNGKRLTDPVNTGDGRIWLPYILSAILSGTAWILLNKQNLDRKRKEKSSVFAEELAAFRAACME